MSFRLVPKSVTLNDFERRNDLIKVNHNGAVLLVCRPTFSVCRLSVTFVRPTQPVEIFGNFSSPFGTLAIL